jgi:ferric-dicitrate binding protein FerR (iron transport regulator)
MSHERVPQSIDEALLDRYLSGEASDDEVSMILAWSDDHPGRAALLHALQDASLHASGSPLVAPSDVSWDVDRAFTAQRTSLFGEQRPRDPKRQNRSVAPDGVFSWASTYTRTTIAVAGLIGSAFLFQITRQEVSGPDTKERVVTHTTGTGQIARVTLRDGSRAVLAPQTTLRIADDFGRGARTVLLDGEAQFDVEAKGAPFVVRTSTANVRVLGTTFSVRGYATDHSSWIAVAKGRVSVATVSRRNSAIALDAGDVAVAGDSANLVRANDSTAGGAAWVEGRLVFHDAPVTDVLKSLSRWYGYQFRLTDSTLAAKSLTAWFTTRSSTEVLTDLKLLLNVDLTFDGTVVTLHTRKARSGSPDRRRTPAIPTHETEVGR